MKQAKLSKEELQIELEADSLRPVSGEKRKRIEKTISHARKNRAISLRISTYDLEKVKEKAELQGLPYQTLINTIIHKYVTNQLFEKEEVLKSLRLLNEENA
jgi:predicted DNA binding CopG/RHH family protein